MPYLLQQLQSKEGNDEVSEVERRGAADGLSEVLLARRDLLPRCLYNTLLPRIVKGETNETKAGALALFQSLAHGATQAFLPHLPKCLEAILNSLLEPSEVVTRQTVATVRVLIEEYGGTYPHLLLPRMQESLFFDSEEARTMAMDLFHRLCEKIAEAVKYGQDFLTIEALSQWQRHALLASIFIARSDPLPDIRRLATLLWKEKVQSGQKAKTEITGVLQQILRALKLSGKPVRVASADRCLAELIGADFTQEDFDRVEPLPQIEGVIFAPSAAFIGVADGDVEAAPAPPPPQRRLLLKARMQEALVNVNLLAPFRSYVEVVVVSCCFETSTRAKAEAAAEAELAPVTDKVAFNSAGSALKAFGLVPVFEKVFEGVEDEEEAAQADSSSDALVYIEGLRMMYGGGHLLLKDATLELRKGRRYGVVGRNGAGKTTLMDSIANGGISQIPPDVKTLHVRPEVLVEASTLTAIQFCQREMPDNKGSDEALEAALQKVGFPAEMQLKSVSELSGGWRMKLLLASAMMRECDILLLDEPTNHLDKASVAWLSDYLVSLEKTSLMVISHDPHFLNAVCTDIIQYSSQRTLDYYRGNFNDFRKVRQITSDEEAEALLLGRDQDDFDMPPEEDEMQAVTSALLDKSSKITFPIPGTLKGHTASKPVMELKGVYFAYDEQEGPNILQDVTCKVTMNSRVGIVGANGAGKSTLLNLLCGELSPSPSPSGKAVGEMFKHRNLRLAYIAQQHMYHLGEFMNSSPYVYIQRRYENGWDEALQRRLIEPADEEEKALRKKLADRWGKYGREVKEIVGRVVRGKEVLYEVAWKDLEDQKQNTYETIAKLKKLGVASLATAYDERFAAQTAGIDQRPLSQKEIVKHLEQFGLDEDMILNREIGGFSAGQKSKLTLGAAFWTKPHVVALDEPTNYIDMETLESLVKALARFKGGVVVISHAGDFVTSVCNETWLVEGGTITKQTREAKK